MTKDESWVAEQARLIDLEDGFGPSYIPAAAAEDIADHLVETAPESSAA